MITLKQPAYFALSLIVFSYPFRATAQVACPSASAECPQGWCGGIYEGLDRGDPNFPIAQKSLVSWLGFDPCVETAPDDGTWSEMNVSQLRQHMWKIWAAVNSPSKTNERHLKSQVAVPKWRTWHTALDVFTPTILPASDLLLSTLSFEAPRELGEGNSIGDRLMQLVKPLTDSSGIRSDSLGGGIAPTPLAKPNRPTAVSLASVEQVVFFNAQAADAISQCCLGGKMTKLSPGKPLTGLAADSIALKTIWLQIPETACSQIPVWDGVPGVPKSPYQSLDSWPRKVSVCAPGIPGGRSLDEFYWVKAEDLPGLTDVTGYMVLVGMHVMTHEIPDWVWATFWWHDHPDSGQFAADRLPLSQGPWNHYLMDVAYDMERPWQSTGLPKAIFNSYLEGSLLNGNQSNCISCHQRARWPQSDLSYVTPDSSGEKLSLTKLVVTGRAAAKNSYLPEPSNCSIPTGFLWSIALRAKPAPNTYVGCPK